MAAVSIDAGVSAVEILEALVRRLAIAPPDEHQAFASLFAQLQPTLQPHGPAPVVDFSSRNKWTDPDLSIMVTNLEDSTLDFPWSPRAKEQVKATLAQARLNTEKIDSAHKWEALTPANCSQKVQAFPSKYPGLFRFDTEDGAPLLRELSESEWEKLKYKTRKAATLLRIFTVPAPRVRSRMLLPALYFRADHGDSLWYQFARDQEPADIQEDQLPEWLLGDEVFQAFKATCCRGNKASALFTKARATYLLFCRDPMAPKPRKVQKYGGEASSGVLNRWEQGGQHHVASIQVCPASNVSAEWCTHSRLLHRAQNALTAPMGCTSATLVECVLAHLFSVGFHQSPQRLDALTQEAALFVHGTYDSEALMHAAEGQLITSLRANGNHMNSH